MIKSIIHIYLSTLLIAAILAPSVIIILNNDYKSWNIIELSDDENKKENKKELNEKDVFFYVIEHSISSFPLSKTSLCLSYIEKGYSNTQDIFLPPPKFTA